MDTDWIKYRKIVAAYYRSANAYFSMCRRENLSSAGMSSIEVQIIEVILEHSEENNNMKWFADQIGISKSAFTNYVNRLTEKKLVEKYYAIDNHKNIILRVTEAGRAAYEEYATVIRSVFDPIFDVISEISEEDRELVAKLLNVWADQQLLNTVKERSFVLIPVER